MYRPYKCELCSFSKLSVPSPRSQLILHSFRRFTYVTSHSPTLPLLHLRYISFSNPSFALLCSFSKLSVPSPTSQHILQSFRRFTYVTAHSPTLPLLHLRHSSFSNPSFALLCPFSKLSVPSPTSQLILESFRRLPTSQLILQPFRCFTYVIVHSLTLLSLCSAHSPTFPSLHLRHSSFSNPSVASPTSKFILQAFFCFSYVKNSSLNSPGEPPMKYA